jgi:protein TonB
MAALLAAAVALGVSATKTPFQLARQPDAPQAATGPAPAPTFRSALSLSAQKTGNSVAITWDSSALANARIAVVTVQDGDLKQEIPLTQERFKMNKVVYVPQSTQFDVTVEVFSKVGEVIREAIVVATGETSIRARSVAPRIQTTPPPPIAAEEDTPDEAKPSVRRLDLQGALNARTRSPEGTINYVPPPDNSPVPLSTPNVMGPEFLQGSGLPSSLPRPAIPPPARTELVQPVEPARPLRRIQPVVPSNVLAMLKKAVSIHVRVQVDANGKVTAAEPISTTSGVIQYLAASATSVARMWTFTPARRGNTPVASELLLQFDFAQK